MRLVFLGTAAAVTSVDRDNTSLLVDNILIDCPGNVFGKLLRTGLNPVQTVDYIFLTHRHIDHVYGLPSFLEMVRLKKREKPLFVYVLDEYVDLVKKLLFLFELSEDKLSFPLRIIPMSETQTYISTNSVSVEAFPVCHSVSNVGLKLSSRHASIVYTSDTEPCETVAKAAKGATVLIHEATCSEVLTGRQKGHSCVEDAAKIANLAGVRLLCLVHLGEEFVSNEGILLEKAQEYFSGKILIPRDLDEIII